MRSKQPELFPRDKTTWEEVKKRVEGFGHPRDDEKVEGEYWVAISQLLKQYMEQEEQSIRQQKEKVSSLRNFSKCRRKVCEGRVQEIGALGR